MVKELKNNKLNLVWWGNNNNWGDNLNPYLISKITKDNWDINRIELNDTTDTHRYYCIGSILSQTYSSNYEIWGAGLESSDSKLQETPKKIHSVRGPLTRKVILGQGIECPEIYGDPALLISKFYSPKVKKKYKYGIIPHFSHKSNPWLSNFIDDPDVTVIDIQDPNIARFIDKVNECEIILSSSLHGIICGDSYNIPSYWIDLSPDGEVNWFKFNDYFISVKRPLIGCMRPDINTKIKDLWPPLYNYFIDIDLDKLLKSCPFIK